MAEIELSLSVNGREWLMFMFIYTINPCKNNSINIRNSCSHLTPSRTIIKPPLHMSQVQEFLITLVLLAIYRFSATSAITICLPHLQMLITCPINIHSLVFQENVFTIKRFLFSFLPFYQSLTSFNYWYM